MSSAAQSQSQYVPHYTFGDYRQWKGDWELWSGIPVATTPSPFGPHQAVAARLARLLGNELKAAGCDCHVLHEIDWVISDDMAVRPDVVVDCRRRFTLCVTVPLACVACVTRRRSTPTSGTHPC